MNLTERIKKMGLTGKAAKEYRKFDRLCKEASQCRDQKGQVSCYSCKMYEQCTIQSELKKVQP